MQIAYWVLSELSASIIMHCFRRYRLTYYNLVLAALKNLPQI